MTDIVLAYDGSAHCGWVGRYAVHLARAGGGRLLCLHVNESTDDAVLEESYAHLISMAETANVPAQRVRLPCEGTVVGTIRRFMQGRTNTLLMLGLRARENGRGLLAGTVSEQLLEEADHDVLAVRVTSPGLLGDARHILYALSQNPTSAQKGQAILRLFAPERLSLLTVVEPKLGRLANPTKGDMEQLSAIGHRFLGDVEGQLHDTLRGATIDTEVRVGSDWPGEAMRHAGRVHAQLMLVGATERSLPRRVVFGNPLERLLRDAICDVAVFRLGHGRR